ncbi:C40 family peptidase [Kitasatospora sp. NPDC001175]|uniref:C40 family peptidase n=1 Tax=Kitasatospora sp. NPDC001175 TaxID=3157103 RepID=UPI003CFD7E0D
MESAAARATTAATAGCLAAFILLAAAAGAALSAATGGLLDLLTDDKPASSNALADIPPGMAPLYQQAALTCPGLPWSILAAIGKIETDHGRAANQTSTAGAVGPMQFLPSTFAQYAEPVPPGGAVPPTPWDPVDAVHAAARLLCASGARNGSDIRAAVFAYNHANWYVDKVLVQAREYAGADPLILTAPNRAAATAVVFARSKIGTPYEWGGTGTDGHGYDCSGLTQAAYAAAGIPIPRVAQDQYNATTKLPPGSALLPGDLVFYGTSTTDITHVGLYVGGDQMIEAPRTGIPVRQASYRPPGLSFVGATRPVR